MKYYTDSETSYQHTDKMTFVEPRRGRSCWRRNRLAILCSVFGLFWCALAVLMILLYTSLVDNSFMEENNNNPQVTHQDNYLNEQLRKGKL